MLLRRAISEHDAVWQVPNYPLSRPAVSTCPFTVSCLPEAEDQDWLESCDARYFLYPVHPSNTFVTYGSVGATLYWAFLKFMHRQYEAAFRAIESCGTDMPLSSSEMAILQMFKAANDDMHPDAHACRLKLRLSLFFSTSIRWPIVADLAKEYASYLTKHCHVSMACRLSCAEEVRLIKHAVKHRARGAVILTRANFLDKLLKGEQRDVAMLIPHDADVHESKHPYEKSARDAHASMFLLPHARAVVVHFDERSHTDDYGDPLTFGDSKMVFAPLPSNGSRPKTWTSSEKGYQIKANTWQTIVIKGCRMDATFKSDSCDEGSWGYRFTCRPALPEELPKVEDGGENDTFMAAVDAQEDGGKEWAKTVAGTIDPYHGGKDFNKLRQCDAVWFGSVSIQKALVQPELRGGQLMKALEDMWGNSFDYPTLMNILSGHTKTTLGGRMLVEMVVRINVLLGKADTGLVSRVLVACVGLSELSDRDLSELPSYADEALGTNPNCYVSGGKRALARADVAERLHVGTYLQAIGERLCGALKRHDSSEIGGPEQATEISLAIGSTCSEASGTVSVSNFACQQYDCTPAPCEQWETATFSQADLNAFAGTPLRAHVDFDEIIATEGTALGVPSKLPFDLTGHPDAETTNACATLERIQQDLEYYAAAEEKKEASVIAGITPVLLQAYEDEQAAAGGPGTVAPVFADAALARLCWLRQRLEAGLVADTARLDTAIEHVVGVANSLPPDASADEAEQRARLEFKLLQEARLRARVGLPQLVACLVSTRATADIQALNPFLSEDTAAQLLHVTAGIVLTAIQVSHLRRTIGCVGDVCSAIEQRIDAKKLRKEIEGLLGNLLAKRHYAEATGGGISFDPRFLLFEYITTFILRKAQVYLVRAFQQRAQKGGESAHGDHTNSLCHQMIMGEVPVWL